MSRDELEAVLHECVSRAGLQRAYVSMTCTRGRPAAGSRDLRTCRNNLYCFAVPYIWVSPEEQQKTGASMWISEIPRIPPESVDPSVKNYHWLDLDMAQFDAYDHDAQMVVLRDLSGAITEGPGYNIFAFVDGRWLTPATGTLHGRDPAHLAGSVRRERVACRARPPDRRRPLAGRRGADMHDGRRRDAGDDTQRRSRSAMAMSARAPPTSAIDTGSDTPTRPGRHRCATRRANSPQLTALMATGFLHPGAMGASFAAACRGERLWCGDGRSAASRARADAQGWTTSARSRHSWSAPT